MHSPYFFVTLTLGGKQPNGHARFKTGDLGTLLYVPLLLNLMI